MAETSTMSISVVVVIFVFPLPPSHYFLRHHLRVATIEGSLFEVLPPSKVRWLMPLAKMPPLLPYSRSNSTLVSTVVVAYARSAATACARFAATAACARFAAATACTRSTATAACAKPITVARTTTAACAKLQPPLLLVYYSSLSHLIELRCYSIAPFLEVSFFN
ncbi:hypothetical protein DEO72_LG10g2258 [Vigna unguiculata]|uniref:Uncharacterized protein n=1 Tax=Vigna unguiculata TaxID=3917 RepID=A0A4D6NFS0_VIGUN|nr:hypothetical protein DEO72_LG10g2258 [Vigna unguiculata]